MNHVVSNTSGDLRVSRSSSKKHDGLFTDTCNFLDQKILAHMGIWAYLNGGRPHLESFFASSDYDGRKEEDLIPQIGAQFARDLPKKISLIELGPGNACARKTSAFIDAFNAASNGEKRIVEYHALDVVKEYAENAATFIQDKYKISGNSIVGDYTSIKEQIDTSATPVLISWNSPVWNAPIVPDVEPDFIYASNLKKIGQLLGHGGVVILTHFPLRDTNEAHRIYNREDCAKAVLAIPGLIEKRLAPEVRVNTHDGKIQTINFSELFDYSVTVNPVDEYVSMDLVAKRDAEISLGAEYGAFLHGNEHLHAVRSAKPSIRRFNNIVRTSGANVINTIQNNEGSVVAQAIQFPEFIAK